MLQFACQHGCAWDWRTCEAAARGGHLAVLQYAHQNGCAWDARTCRAAAREGHLAVLQFAHQNGCQWGPVVCSAAAERGNLSILKWLRQHECQWDSHTTHRAAVYKHLELLTWARQQQPPCPWWSYQECCDWSPSIQWLNLSPCVLVYLVQQRAFLPVRQVMRAQVVATEMTYAVLSLRAALPEETPREVVLTIVNMAVS